MTRGGPGALNLVKLCVGAEGVADLAAYQEAMAPERTRLFGAPTPRHRTRMRPKRADELLDGGSLYWVFRGRILARQTLLAIEDAADETAVDLVLDPAIRLTVATPRRPFQGWRYLPGSDAPADLARAPYAFTDEEEQETLPSALREAIAEYGVI